MDIVTRRCPQQITVTYLIFNYCQRLLACLSSLASNIEPPAVLGAGLLLAGLTAPVSAASRVSCTTSSDLEGQPASVICHFPEDISVSRDHFRVYRYDFNRQHYLPEIVGECHWYDGKSTPDCATLKGFQFDSTISDTVTLTIPVSSQHHAGVYRCDYSNLDYSPTHGCDLYVRGNSINCTGASVYEGEPANVTCHYNSDLSITYDSFYISRLRPYHKHRRDVLTCLWLERDLTKPDCFVNPAFTLTDKVSRTVTIYTPAANQSHVGRYYCDIVPTRKDVTLRHCYVEVKERIRTTSVLTPSASRGPSTTGHAATTASTIDYTPAGLAGQKKTPEDTSRVAGVRVRLLSVSTGITSVTVGVLLLYIWMKRYHHQRKTVAKEPLRQSDKQEPTSNGYHSDDDAIDCTSKVCGLKWSH